jgi:hypothetical protein
MKSVTKYAIVSALLVAGLVSAAAAPASGKGKASAPGQADNFYRGITTVGSTSTTETVTNVTVLESVTETRTIGSGQNNSTKGGNKDGNLQDRTVETVQTVVTDITTVTVEAHRGAPVSNGKDLSYTEVTETVVSDTISTVVGDWGSAYDVPSEVK